MYVLDQNVANIKRELISLINLHFDNNLLYSNIYKENHFFIDGYLNELYAFERHPINREFPAIILTELDFYRYLQNYSYTMVFEGKFIKLALCKESRVRFYVCCFCPTDLI